MAHVITVLDSSNLYHCLISDHGLGGGRKGGSQVCSPGRCQQRDFSGRPLSLRWHTDFQIPTLETAGTSLSRSDLQLTQDWIKNNNNNACTLSFYCVPLYLMLFVTQRGQVTCPRSHSRLVSSPGFRTKFVWLQHSRAVATLPPPGSPKTRISGTAVMPQLTFSPPVMVMATLEEDLVPEGALGIAGLDHRQN